MYNSTLFNIPAVTVFSALANESLAGNISANINLGPGGGSNGTTPVNYTAAVKLVLNKLSAFSVSSADLNVSNAVVVPRNISVRPNKANNMTNWTWVYDVNVDAAVVYYYPPGLLHTDTLSSWTANLSGLRAPAAPPATKSGRRRDLIAMGSDVSMDDVIEMLRREGLALGSEAADAADEAPSLPHVDRRVLPAADPSSLQLAAGTNGSVTATALTPSTNNTAVLVASLKGLLTVITNITANITSIANKVAAGVSSMSLQDGMEANRMSQVGNPFRCSCVT